MGINDSNIRKRVAPGLPSGNGSGFQVRKPRGDEFILPWQPPGGPAVVKSVQQPTQSDNPAGGSSNGVAESYMKNWTAYDGNKRFGNTQFPDASANQGGGNQGGSLVQGNLSTADIPRTLDPEFSFDPGGTPGAATTPVNPPAGGQQQPVFDGTTRPPADGAGNTPGAPSTPNQPLDPGFGVSPGGTTGDSAGGNIDPGFGVSPDGTSSGTDASSKTIYDWYKEYLEKLGGYKTPSATSQEEMIRKMYEASLAANKSQLESDYNQNLSDLDAEASTIGSTYYEQQRQAQAQSDRNRQAFQEYANARGLNSGTGGQAELAQQNQLAANMNNLRQSEAEKRAEIERQRVLLGQQYQSAIQKAQADNDLNLAKALYEEAVRVDESLTSAAKADADRALQMFNILSSSVKDSIGSSSSDAYSELFGASGGDTKQIDKMYNMAKQIKSRGGYYTKSSTGGTTFKQATSSEIEQAEYYINLINLAGGVDRVKEYILGHYKELQSDTGGKIGYQERFQIGDIYQKRAGNYSNGIYQVGTDLGKGIADGLAPGQSYTNTKDGSVWARSPINGKLYVTKNGVTMEASYQEGYKG